MEELDRTRANLQSKRHELNAQQERLKLSDAELNASQEAEASRQSLHQLTALRHEAKADLEKIASLYQQPLDPIALARGGRRQPNHVSQGLQAAQGGHSENFGRCDRHGCLLLCGGFLLPLVGDRAPDAQQNHARDRHGPADLGRLCLFGGRFASAPAAAANGADPDYGDLSAARAPVRAASFLAAAA